MFEISYNDLDDKAATPIRPDLVKHLGMGGYNLTTGAICVYPNQVKSAVKWLKVTGKEIPVASVATGFPAGQTPLRLRLEEIREAVADGATEIDIVINRTMVNNSLFITINSIENIEPFSKFNLGPSR